MDNRDQVDYPRASRTLVSFLGSIESDATVKVLLAIGRIGDEGAFEVLEENLQPKKGLRGLSEKPEDIQARRSASALALGFLQDDRAFDLLIARLEDPSSQVRGAAAAALGNCGDQRAVLPLLDALADPECSKVAVEALRQLHRGGLAINVPADKVLDLLGGPDAGAQYRAIAAMCFIRDARFVAPLIKKLGEIGPKEWILKAKVVEALGMQGDRSVVDTLLGLLRDQIPEVRAAAAVALGNLQDPSAVEPLIGILEDNKHPIRNDAPLKRRAVVALGKIGDKRAVASLTRVLQSGDQKIKIRAAESLGKIGGPETTGALASVFGTAYGEMRLTLISALANTGDGAAVPPLLAPLKSRTVDEDEIREAAIQALVTLGDVAIPGMILALDHKNVRIRDGAARVLQQLQAKDALGPLLEAASDPRSGIQESAFLALTKSDDPRAVAAVDAGLDNADPQIRSHAIRAIASREAPPIERIVPMLQDPEDEVKVAASTELLRLGEEQARPVLMALLGHKKKRIRLKAVSALETIGSPVVIESLVETVRGLGPQRVSDFGVGHAAMSALVEIEDPRATQALIDIATGKGINQTRSSIAMALAESVLRTSLDDLPLRVKSQSSHRIEDAKPGSGRSAEKVTDRSRSSEAQGGGVESGVGRKALESAMATEVAAGYRVESQTDRDAMLIKGKRPNHVLHIILSIVTAGLWIPVWLILVLAKGEKRLVLHVDDRANVVRRTA